MTERWVDLACLLAQRRWRAGCDRSPAAEGCMVHSNFLKDNDFHE